MHNNSLILSVYRDDNNISVQVRYSNATCDAWVYFSPEYKMKLEDIIDVTNKTIKSVILYKGSDITAVNKTISVDNTKEISAHVPSLFIKRDCYLSGKLRSLCKESKYSVVIRKIKGVC